MELEFWKLSGAGNDFIVINNMDGRLPQEGREDMFARWCRRGTDIGSDGVLVVEPSPGMISQFKMRYYNADGREAETCGNGSRCIARFAYEQGIADAKMRFDTKAGPYDAQVFPNGEVAVRMTEAFGLRENIQIEAAGAAVGSPANSGPDAWSGEVHFINTGVPHVVIFVDDLKNLDVFGIGRRLRSHPEFMPAGTNINFVRVHNPHHLEVRTYERGVEAETLACGTGSIASAIIATRQLLAEQPVGVKTASGEVLTISFEPAPAGAKSVTLQGSANIIFRGYVECELLEEAGAKSGGR